MRITGRSALPDICINCAVPAELVYKVRRSVNTSSEFGEQAAIVAAIGMFFGVFPSLSNHDVETLVLKIPVCKECLKVAKPSPVQVDIPGGYMSFVVHREFKLRSYER